MLDKAGSVRTGEELDTVRISKWLNNKLPELTGTPQITQYSGGASNWTYCLTYPHKEIILRRAPLGSKAKGAHDMGREYRLQKAIKSSYAYAPEMLALCEDKSIIGSDFYVMEKLNGIIPRRNFPSSLTPKKEKAKEICHSVLDCLIELHQVDYKAAGLENLAKGAGYNQRQIHGWSHRYTQAKTWNVPTGKKVIDWLKINLPKSETICLTHNDFRFDNIVLDQNNITKVIGVLDWELATLGDPLMDLGNLLAYWVEADDDFLARATRRQPTHLAGMLTRKEVINYYCKKMNISLENIAFYEVYGLFRLAGIVQQIYFRYHHKQTRNPAFKNFWLFVHYLLWRCKKIIKINET
jgi:aminoglycoside phosphotransferase (APT) family kinase protein